MAGFVTKAVRINGCSEWRDLTDKFVRNKIVCVENCRSVHTGYGPKFPDATAVSLKRCDRIFVYYYLNKFHFPKLEKIYLSSHPCDPSVFQGYTKTHIYLSDEFGIFKDRWARDLPNVAVLPRSDIDRYLSSLAPEPLLVESLAPRTDSDGK